MLANATGIASRTLRLWLRRGWRTVDCGRRGDDRGLGNRRLRNLPLRTGSENRLAWSRSHAAAGMHVLEDRKGWPRLLVLSRSPADHRRADVVIGIGFEYLCPGLLTLLSTRVGEVRRCHATATCRKHDRKRDQGQDPTHRRNSTPPDRLRLATAL